MRARRRIRGPGPQVWLSLPAVVLGLLAFLAVAVTAGALSRAVTVTRIQIEGFDARDKAPVPVECARGQARSLDSKYVFNPVAELPALASRTWSGTPFTNFLAEMSGEGGCYVLFLVRPDGIETFEALRQVLQARNAALCTASAELGAEPARDSLRGLPDQLRRKVRVAGKQVFFDGPMAEGDLDLLAQKLGPAARGPLGQLYGKSQRSAVCVDHGAELLPAEWNFERGADGQVRFGPAAR